MKKIIFLALLAMPCFAMAQSEWEIPESAKAQNVEKQKKHKKEKTGADNKQSDKQKKQGEDTVSEPVKMKIDVKYAAGTVPEVDGKVVFEKTIKAPGVSADVLYDRVLNAFTDITKQPNQLENSRISVVNKREHIIAAQLIEEMVFSKGALAKDFCNIKYTLIATCHNGSVDLQFFRISYTYDIGRANESTYKAEEWITDKEALNKKGTNLYHGNGKFRKKTIDRKDEIFAYIESKIK